MQELSWLISALLGLPWLLSNLFYRLSASSNNSTNHFWLDQDSQRKIYHTTTRTNFVAVCWRSFFIHYFFRRIWRWVWRVLAFVRVRWFSLSLKLKYTQLNRHIQCQSKKFVFCKSWLKKLNITFSVICASKVDPDSS